MLPPTLLETVRVKGDKYIVPDDATKRDIGRSGKDKVIGSYKLCVDVNGDVASVKMLKSTGFPGYDFKIVDEMKQWGYRPYMINGAAVPVCTAVTFIYTQSQPAPPPASP